MENQKIERIDEIRDLLRKQASSGKARDQKLEDEMYKLMNETGYAEEIELDYD